MGGNGSGAKWESEAEKSSKSFWSFKRSASLNCDIKKSLICSFPILVRSNSIGPVAYSKRAMLSGPGANPSSHQIPSSPSSLCCSVHQFRPQKLTGEKGWKQWWRKVSSKSRDQCSISVWLRIHFTPFER